MPRVALFVTCLADQIRPETGVAAVRLLEAAGCEVVFPEDQTCCGQPGVTAGEPEAAARLARHWVDVFAAADVDAVVAPSGSCVAMVHHWFPRLLEGSRLEQARALAERTHELTAFLIGELGRRGRGAPDLGARVGGRVTVHDACHGLRALGVRDAPRALLDAAGAAVVEMDEPETCCGFGGVFATTHPEISVPLADAKLADAASTGADCLTSCDAACLLHLEGRRRRTGVGPEPRHVAELLAEGLGATR